MALGCAWHFGALVGFTVVIPAWAVLTALQALPVAKADRLRPEAKARQLEILAVAIAGAVEGTPQWRGDPVDLASLLIAIAYQESRFALDVHAGTDRPHAKSAGLFQIEWLPNHLARRQVVGLSLDETTTAASAAAAILAHSWQCGPSRADILTAYAARKCGAPWPTLGQRVATANFVRMTIMREMWAE